MDVHDRLRQHIQQQRDRLRAGIPRTGAGTLLALIRALDDPRATGPAPDLDLVAGAAARHPGASLALQLCLEASGDAPASAEADTSLDNWATQFLASCRNLATADQVLTHVSGGFMRLLEDGHGEFDAWIAARHAPASWREAAGFAWLREWREGQQVPAGKSPLAGTPDLTAAYQLDYAPDTILGGCPVRLWRDVLAWLARRARRAHERGEPPGPHAEGLLVEAIASDLAADPELIRRAIGTLTLTPGSAAWHVTGPDVAPAPLVHSGPGSIAWSLAGLTDEPYLFLARELRRRDPQAYHSAAAGREAIFRRDLYDLFTASRFVTSPGRIELRREGGNIRTDIDAVVFDRKTGTLGLFELKSPDPFARTAGEAARQRDNLLQANRQLAGILDWVQRHGADEIVNRVDRRTARTFRANKVVAFALGRYTAHAGDGARLDRRAAWGSWPQVLRLLESQPGWSTTASPLTSLHARLASDAGPIRPPATAPSCEIPLGEARLTIHASWAACQASQASRRQPGS